jgi:hypothetical protein
MPNLREPMSALIALFVLAMLILTLGGRDPQLDPDKDAVLDRYYEQERQAAGQ